MIRRAYLKFIPLFPVQQAFYSKTIDLRGVFPPLVTIFKENQSIDYDSQSKNLEKYEKVNFAGYVLFGTTGEGVMLTENERIEGMQKLRRALPNRTLIAGVKCESTAQTIKQAKDMANSGADAALVGSPTIFKANITDKDLISFFLKVADESPIPIIVYNMPGAFGVDLTAEIVLATSGHPNIIGYKDSGGEIPKMTRIAFEKKSDKFQVLAGGAGFLLPAMMGGSVGGICALANVLGKEVINLHQLILSKEFDKAKDLQARMIHPNFLVTRKYGVPALKYALELFGYSGGVCREPIGQLSQSAKDEIKHSFMRNKFL